MENVVNRGKRGTKIQYARFPENDRKFYFASKKLQKHGKSKTW